MLTVTDRIRDLFRTVLGTEPPGDADDVIENGLLDSLSLVELIFAIEEEFQFAVPLDTIDIETFRSIERITTFVETRIADAA